MNDAPVAMDLETGAWVELADILDEEQRSLLRRQMRRRRRGGWGAERG